MPPKFLGSPLGNFFLGIAIAGFGFIILDPTDLATHSSVPGDLMLILSGAFLAVVGFIRIIREALIESSRRLKLKKSSKKKPL
jgi:hypothetical protein